MIIIGERINSTRKSIKEAIDRKDIKFLIGEAKKQVACGANFIDINCAVSMEKEIDNLSLLITKIQQELSCAISIDSPNPDTIKAALAIHKGKPFINSVTAEKKNLGFLSDLNNANIICLTIDESGMPQDLNGRIALAERIIEQASGKGIEKDNIYIDSLVKPVSTEPKQAAYFLEAVKALKEKQINTIGGLSNVSFGLPKRDILNAAFLKLAMEAGITAAIIDPTAGGIKMILDGEELPEEIFGLAKATLLGEDEYSMNYIRAFREGKLEF